MYLHQDQPAQPDGAETLIVLDPSEIEAKIDRDNAERYQLLYAAARQALIDRGLDDTELGIGPDQSGQAADRVIAGYLDDLRYLIEQNGASLKTNTRPITLADEMVRNMATQIEAAAHV